MSHAGIGRYPDLGVGVGLRVPHYAAIEAERPAVDFFELISENFMVDGGKPRHHLDLVLGSYAVVQHGVSLGIGSPEAPSREYLARLKALVRHAKPAWVSDHFCWCGTRGAHLHDLLPLPFTEEAVGLVAERARMVQDVLEVPFLLENTSSLLAYTASTLREWEFVSEVVERADIGLLLDVNNVYVSAYNHGFDPHEFLRGVPGDRIAQIHVAGHTHLGTHIVDTHRGPIIDPVWDLYREAIELAGSVTTLIEWDDEIPELAVLLAEAEKARGIRREITERARGDATRAIASRSTAAGDPGRAAVPEHATPAPDARGGPRRPEAQGGPRESAGVEATLPGE